MKRAGTIQNLNRDIRSIEMSSMNRTDPHDHDPYGDKRVMDIHSRVISEGTNGLCRFDQDGNLVLAVDPAKYAGVA